MLPTIISEAPVLDSFTAITEHQERTPNTFFSSKPILHYYSPDVRVFVSEDPASRLPMFAPSTENGADANAPERGVVAAIFVNTADITLFNTTTSTGVSIPYSALVLHGFEGTSNSDAPRSRQLLLHLEFSNPEGVSDEDEPETLQLKFLGMPDEELQTLFDEVTNCTNLSDGINGGDYMDNGEGGDSRIIFEGSVGYDGMGGLPASQAGVSVRDFAINPALPPPFPGSGGWITAENVNEFFDADGNFIDRTLGDGAGRVRGYDEVDGEGLNGHTDVDDNKRPRTE